MPEQPEGDAPSSPRTARSGRDGSQASASVLLLGDSPLARGVDAALRSAGGNVEWLRRPVDRDLRRALARRPAAVAVISRDDFVALRTALLVEYLLPKVRLIVTIFDRTVARQLIAAIPNCQVLSMADAAVGSILGPCMDPTLATLFQDDGWMGIVADGEQPEPVRFAHRAVGRLRRAHRRVRAQLRPYDRTARLLLGGLGGLLALLCAETAIALVGGDDSFAEAVYSATKSATTVGPSDVLEHGSAWLKLYGVVSMAAAVVLTAVVTAALVNRILSRRLTGIVGARTLPRSDHVVVVGLGQVGLRLCLELRNLGVEVIAVEQDGASPHVNLACELNIPVVIGRGGDRFVLERLALSRARALAAVTSDELANIAISVTALAVQPGLRTVLRAGSNDVTRETQALFPVGVAQDLDRIAAAAIAAAASGHDLTHAFLHRGHAYLRLSNRQIIRFPVPSGDG